MKTISQKIEDEKLETMSQAQFAEELRTARRALTEALPVGKPGASARYQRMFRRFSERFGKPA